MTDKKKKTIHLPAEPFDEDRKLGHVEETTMESFVFELIPNEDGETVGVGDYVIVKTRNNGIVGPIRDVKKRSDDDAALIASVELQATLDLERGRFLRGLHETVLPFQKVYLLHSRLLQLLLEDRSADEEVQEVSFNIAFIDDLAHTPVSLPAEKLFGRHCAVLGSSGGGKSWTLARLLEECGQFQSKILLLDATGEFYTLDHKVRHVHIGIDQDIREDSIEVTVPFYQLRENDLFAIFKPEGQSQGPRLRTAMKSLKLARLAPHLAADGSIAKAFRSKNEYEKQYQTHVNIVESSDAVFDINKLVKQIQQECVFPNQSQSEPYIWGGPNSQDLAECTPLLNRIQDVLTTKSLSPIFQPKEKTSLFEVFNDFMLNDDERILRISLQHLPFLHNAREIITNAIGRYLLELGRDGAFKNNPLVIFLDEAHQFLNAITTTGGTAYPLDSFELIAKEGRKYALTCCLATQRPRDIPESVLSQMGTLIVHRLINHHDRYTVERAAADLDNAAARSLPILSPGQAIILGVDFHIPLQLQIRAPANPPDSRGPDYQSRWSNAIPEPEPEPDPEPEPKKKLSLASLAGKRSD